MQQLRKILIERIPLKVGWADKNEDEDEDWRIEAEVDRLRGESVEARRECVLEGRVEGGEDRALWGSENGLFSTSEPSSVKRILSEKSKP